MKKRLLSLLFAVITIFNMMPWGVMASETENEANDPVPLDVSELEMDKLYFAVFSSTFPDTYLYDKDFNLYKDPVYGYETTIMKSELPETLKIKLLNEGDTHVFVTNEDWPAKYEDYRYIKAEEIVITGECDAPNPPAEEEFVYGEVGLTVGGKTVENLVIAKGDKVYVSADLSDAITGTPTYIWQLLIDSANDVWAVIQDYIYPYAVVSEALIANAGIDGGNVTLRCVAEWNGASYVSSELGISVSESYPDEAPVSDYAASVEPISYNNVESAGDSKVALLSTRTVSEEPATVSLMSTRSVTEEYPKVAKLSTKAAMEAFQMQVEYTYKHTSESKNGDTAANPFTVTIPAGGSFTGTVPSTSVVGYLPVVSAEYKKYIQLPSGITDIEDARMKTSYNGVNYYIADTLSFTAIEGHTLIPVYYIPQKVNFRVLIYEQKLYTDGYDLVGTETGEGIADCPVGEGLAEARTGFTPLFYDPEIIISGDGMTVVKIYYDRNYYLVKFDLNDADKGSAYGATPLYVRYNTQVMLPTPTLPGYTFNGWDLVSVYEGVKQNNSSETVPGAKVEDSNILSGYDKKDGGKVITVQHMVNYKANWETATTTYTVIYWVENANNDDFSVAGYSEVTGATPGTEVDATDNIPTSILNSIGAEKTGLVYIESISDKDVTVKGDGTSSVNVYYKRKLSALYFYANAKCALELHTHNDSCQATCTQEAHTHSIECGVASQTCGKEEHEHTAACCSVTYHKHGEGECVCNITEHTHNVNENCYTCVEHTHVDSCYDHQLSCYSSKAAQLNAPGNNNNYTASINNPQSGYVYRYRTGSNWNATYYNYFYFNGSWYYLGNSRNIDDIFSNYGITVPSRLSNPSQNQYTSVKATITNCQCSPNDEEHTHGDGNCSYKDTEHTHGEGTCPCNETVHDHTSGCNYICGKEPHTHTTSCYTYNCGKTEHSHTGVCFRGCTEVEHKSHSSACNSTSSYSVVYAAMVKYGADTTSVWNNAPVYRWKLTQSSTRAYTTAPTMPDEDLSTYGESLSGASNKYTIHFYERGTTNKIREDTVYYRSGGSSLGDEDYIDVPGFTLYTGDSEATNREFVVQYTRNSYEITFNDGEREVYSKTLPFEADISNVVNEFTLQTPSSKETGSVKFVGWYTTPTCADGTEFDFAGQIMPINGVHLFAKWEDCSYTGKVYLDSSKTELLSEQTVLFGKGITVPDYKDNDKYTSTYKDMIFSGWYYMDGSEEKRFDFNTMVIKQDLDIYAKWTSHVPVQYTVYYVLKDHSVHVADPMEGECLAGESKTFVALTGSDLYEGYRAGYFPTDRSHSIVVTAAGENAVYFEYTAPEKIEYSVVHNFVCDEFQSIIGTDTINLEIKFEIAGTNLASQSASMHFDFQFGITKTDPSDPNKLLVDIDKIIEATGKNNLSDDQKDKIKEIIIKLTPDHIQQDLTFTVDESNVVTFNWSERTTVTTYQVIYYLQNLNSNGVPDGTYKVDYTPSLAGSVGVDVTAEAIEYNGYTFNGSRSNQTGKITKATIGDPNSGLILRMYYDRNQYDYTVHHYKQGTTVTLDTDESGKAYFGAIIKISDVANSITGYDLSNGSESIEIVSDKQKIICYYTGKEVIYRYQIAGNTSGGYLSVYAPDSVTVGGNRPEATELEMFNGYYLNGWYYQLSGSDEKIAVPDSWISEGQMTLQPTVPTEELANKTVTVYAEVLPTILEISITEDVEKGVIFNITGANDFSMRVAVFEPNRPVSVYGLTNGATYTVTMDPDWAWQYGVSEGTCEVLIDKQYESASFKLIPPGDGATSGNIIVTDGAHNNQ